MPRFRSKKHHAPPPHHRTLASPERSPSRFAVVLWWCAVASFFGSVCFAAFVWYTHPHTTKDDIIVTDGDARASVRHTLSALTTNHSYKRLRGFDDGRINILLLGRANSHKSGKDLTDTIMIASINTTDYTVGLLSLPRDLLVAHGNHYVKINALYQSGLRDNVGVRYISDTVTDITGQDIHYYVVMDFAGFVDIIDTLGGINVTVPRHIRDTRYPGPGYSYETFEVYPGLQAFDGETALKYARTRHDDIEGDFGRAKRQQQIMQAAKNKAFSLGTIMNPIKIVDILTTLDEHVRTNVSIRDIEPFIALTKKVNTQHINNIVIDAWKPDSLLISARYATERGGMSGLVPRTGNYTEIREQADNLFNQSALLDLQKAIRNEHPTITLIDATHRRTLGPKVKKTLTRIGFENLRVTTARDAQEKTIIYDNTHGKKPFTLDTLRKKITAQHSAHTQPEYETDFVIVVGDDMVEKYRYTEISQQELEKSNQNTTP